MYFKDLGFSYSKYLCVFSHEFKDKLFPSFAKKMFYKKKCQINEILL